ncbi:MAG: dTDP-4-dehydrorhamnose reductase [Nitrosospira multiformis]|nr:dTDP-4-dehydrorhamnose reductase [Nitrosospira multiformis]
MKILLFGKDGQVGWELQRSLAPLGEVVALDSGRREFCGDFTRLDGITDTVRAVAPDVIVNAAAHTAVDKAESEPECVRIINTLAPAILAREAGKLGAWLVHYSTDYVFDGSGNAFRAETDPTNPLNVYGMTKLEAEQAILTSGCNHFIFRTSWVFAARGSNFAKTMLRLAQQRDSLNVIDDQVGAPTGAELLADITAHAIRLSRQRQNISGLYHLAAAGETSWYGYANFVLNFARREGVKLTVAPENVFPVTSSEFPSAARRPKNSRLDTGKLQSVFDLSLPPWETGVARMLTEILEKPL